METNGGQGGAPWTGFCSVVAVDSTAMWYRACSVCERPLPDGEGGGVGPPPPCRTCDRNAFNPGSSGSKRLYRIFLSIATDERVMVVVCFDRAAQVLFGCSADEFFRFCNVIPFAAEAAGEILSGEIFNITLNSPKNGNAQHLRIVSIMPARSDFCPVINTLRKIYGLGVPSCVHEIGGSSLHRQHGKYR